MCSSPSLQSTPTYREVQPEVSCILLLFVMLDLLLYEGCEEKALLSSRRRHTPRLDGANSLASCLLHTSEGAGWGQFHLTVGTWNSVISYKLWGMLSQFLFF